MSNDNRRYGLGYALAPKKKRSFVQSKLVELARAKGIDMFCIDSEKPLADQGPFDCILHKVNGDEWKNELRDYENMYPGVCIIDRPEAIKRLHDRSSMLQVGCALRDVAAGSSTFCVPKQIVVRDSVNLLDLGGLRFPVIAKPLVADGSVKSHKMLLVYNTEGLGKLKPPLVLQEFVNHGGVIFKVYVVGDFVKCVRRRSLPDVPKDMLNGSVGSLSFCQISNLNKPTQSEDVFDAELPPQELLVRVAAGLRRELKLHLFNFDVIRDTKAGNRYLVIDINYFPGYAKMPGYEPVMADFFWKIFHDRDSLQRGISEDHSHHDYQHSLENGGADAGVSTGLKINGSPHIDVQGEADARVVNDSKGNASTSIVDENGEADAEAAIDSKGSVSTSTVVENGEATTDSKGNAHPSIDVENGEADKGVKIDSKGNAHPSIDVENGEADKGVKIDSKGNAYPSIDVENGEADKGVKIDSKGNASPGIDVEKGDDDVGVSIDSKKNRSRGIVFPIQDGLVSHQ